MPRRDPQRLQDQIREIAQRLTEGEECLTAAEQMPDSRRTWRGAAPLGYRSREAQAEIL